MRINLNDSISNISAEFNIATISMGIRSGYQTMSFLTAGIEPTTPAKASTGYTDPTPINITHRVWKIAKTTVKAVIYLDRFNVSNSTAIVSAGIFLALANIFGAMKVDRPLEFTAKVWMNTPALIVITDIALLALEFQYNPAKVCMAVAGIALTILLPKIMEQRLVAIAMPLFSFAFGGPLLKTEIAIEVIALAFLMK